MLTTRDLKRYRELIEAAVADLGRDDMGVGDVRETHDGKVTVEFRRGTHSDVREISVGALETRRERAPSGDEGDPAPEQVEVEQDVMRNA